MRRMRVSGKWGLPGFLLSMLPGLVVNQAAKDTLCRVNAPSAEGLSGCYSGRELKIMKQRSSFIFDVDEGDFRERVIEASARCAVLVDFWAAWCAPCLALTPALERAVLSYDGKISLAKIEVDDNMRLAGHYRLRGFPTVILFLGGVEVGRFSESRPFHWIHDWIANHIRDADT